MNEAARAFMVLIEDDTLSFHDKAERCMGVGLSASDQISAEAMSPDS